MTKTVCLLPGSSALTLLALGCSHATNAPPSSPSTMSFFPAEAAGNPPPPEAAKTTLLPEDASRQYDTLRSLEEYVLCVLPCTAWIRPESRLHVQIDEEGSSRRVDVPVLDVANESVVVEPQRGHPVAGALLIAGSLLPLALGTFTLGLCTEGHDAPPGQDASGLAGNCVPGVISASIGAALLAAGVAFVATGRPGRLSAVGKPTAEGPTLRVGIAPAGMGIAF